MKRTNRRARFASGDERCAYTYLDEGLHERPERVVLQPVRSKGEPTYTIKRLNYWFDTVVSGHVIPQV